MAERLRPGLDGRGAVLAEWLRPGLDGRGGIGRVVKAGSGWQGAVLAEWLRVWIVGGGIGRVVKALDGREEVLEDWLRLTLDGRGRFGKIG